MMGTAIVGGVGLAVGLGLLIWGLVERGKRAKAEQRVVKLEGELKTALEKKREQAAVHDMRLKNADAKSTRQNNEVARLNAIVAELRRRLLACDDPATIDAWLDDELNRTF
jgi:hypothetical protein